MYMDTLCLFACGGAEQRIYGASTKKEIKIKLHDLTIMNIDYLVTIGMCYTQHVFHGKLGILTLSDVSQGWHSCCLSKFAEDEFADMLTSHCHVPSFSH